MFLGKLILDVSLKMGVILTVWSTQQITKTLKTMI